MKLITQYKTVKDYYLDEDGGLYNCDKVKMVSNTINTIYGPKTMTRDKWIAIVYMGAPTDKKFYTKRNVKGELTWKLKLGNSWVSLNTYVPEIDDNRTTYFYYLCDSRDGIPKYVGKTINPKVRFNAHKLDSKRHTNHKTNWINKVINSGGNIEMCVIDELIPDGTEGSGDWRWLEEYWAQQFISWGFDIIVDGGWGNGGMKRKATNDEKVNQRNIQASLTGKKCYLYDIYNKTYEVFGSKRDSARFLIEKGIINSKLPKTLQFNTTFNGEYFLSDTLLSNDELYDKLKELTNWDIKVVQMTMDFTNVIKEYRTGRQAMRENNCATILGVLNPKQSRRKSALGYRWVSKLDLVYKGVDYLRTINEYNFTQPQYTKELINDCVSDEYTYDELNKKYGISKGTIGNIKKTPNKYYDMI